MTVAVLLADSWDWKGVATIVCLAVSIACSLISIGRNL